MSIVHAYKTNNKLLLLFANCKKIILDGHDELHASLKSDLGLWIEADLALRDERHPPAGEGAAAAAIRSAASTVSTATALQL